MLKEFMVEGISLLIDTAKTKDFYLTQPLIIESCDCADCRYYFETFTKIPLEIFSIIDAMGADLQRNLNSEPTGVWCIRYPEEQFVHCEQMYGVVGTFKGIERSKVQYEKEELGYKVRASCFTFPEVNDFIHIWLSIDKL